MVDGWIYLKETDFFCSGVHLLTERWEKVIAIDRKYFEKVSVKFPFKQMSFILHKKQLKLI